MILIVVVMAAPSMYWSLQSHDVWVYFDYYYLLLVLLVLYYYMIHPWHDPCTLWHDPSMPWSMHICDYRCGGWSLAVLQTSLKTWWLPNIKSTGLQWWHGYGGKLFTQLWPATSLQDVGWLALSKNRGKWSSHHRYAKKLPYHWLFTVVVFITACIPQLMNECLILWLPHFSRSTLYLLIDIDTLIDSV